MLAHNLARTFSTFVCRGDLNVRAAVYRALRGQLSLIVFTSLAFNGDFRGGVLLKSPLGQGDKMLLEALIVGLISAINPMLKKNLEQPLFTLFRVTIFSLLAAGWIYLELPAGADPLWGLSWPLFVLAAVNGRTQLSNRNTFRPHDLFVMGR